MCRYYYYWRECDVAEVYVAGWEGYTGACLYLLYLKLQSNW